MENYNMESNPILLTDEELNSDLWEVFYSHKTDQYKFKIEIQNHPIPNSDERISCIGITVLINDSNDFKEVIIQQLPNKKINTGFDKPSGKLKIYYDKADINNIINFLVNSKPIRITYGVFKSVNYKDKPYAAIELDNF